MTVPGDGQHGVGARVVIVGAAGFTNLGDDAILAAMLRELRDALPGARFTVASGSPEPVAETHGVDAIQLRDTRALDATMAFADLAIIGGGGFIFDFDGILTAYDFLRGDVTFMYPYYRAALCARSRDVPLYFYAIGVDSLVTPVGRALARDVLSLATAITVRDPLSLLELDHAGVRAPVEVTADPAVRAEPPQAAWAGRPPGRVVGFVARPWLRFAGTWTQSAEQFYNGYCGWLADAADHVVEAWDATPVFLAGQRYNDDDLEAAQAIISRMARAERAVVAADVVDEEQYRAAFAAVDALVSTRLHPLILAAGAGVPVVGIALSAKVRAFLCGLDLGELAFSPWPASRDGLRQALDRALGDPRSILTSLSNGLERQRAAAARNPVVAAELLAGSARGAR